MSIRHSGCAVVLVVAVAAAACGKPSAPSEPSPSVLHFQQGLHFLSFGGTTAGCPGPSSVRVSLAVTARLENLGGGVWRATPSTSADGTFDLRIQLAPRTAQFIWPVVGTIQGQAINTNPNFAPPSGPLDETRVSFTGASGSGDAPVEGHADSQGWSTVGTLAGAVVFSDRSENRRPCVAGTVSWVLTRPVR